MDRGRRDAGERGCADRLRRCVGRRGSVSASTLTYRGSQLLRYGRYLRSRTQRISDRPDHSARSRQGDHRHKSRTDPGRERANREELHETTHSPRHRWVAAQIADRLRRPLPASQPFAVGSREGGGAGGDGNASDLRQDPVLGRLCHVGRGRDRDHEARLGLYASDSFQHSEPACR